MNCSVHKKKQLLYLGLSSLRGYMNAPLDVRCRQSNAHQTDAAAQGDYKGFSFSVTLLEHFVSMEVDKEEPEPPLLSNIEGTNR